MKFIRKILDPGHGSASKAQRQESAPKAPLHASLAENIRFMKEKLGNSGDIVIREIRIGTETPIQAGIVYASGLVDTHSANSFIMETLMLDIQKTSVGHDLSSGHNLLNQLKDSVLTVGDVQQVTDFTPLFTSLLAGCVILLLEGYEQALSIDMSGWEGRSVTEPVNEAVVRGPRESFTENLRTNTTLIRRKINDPNLWLESRKIGRITKTEVAVMHINGIANDKIVQEVRTRLDRIDIDAILESGNIEELIQESTLSPFPTVYNTERPDVIAAELLEGKVVIIVDGTPFVLVVPALFISFFHSAEDYYQRADISSLIRILRFIGIFIALLGPSLYIAITTFHQEMLPTQLLIGLAAQREGVPFPAFIEALMMEITFEILREAGIRMPRTIGQAVSIVGTLVIGQAAVEAGIVSAAMVIVVSITAISNFVFPSINMSISIRMLRFPLMGLAASFGIFGIIVGIIAMVLHLCSLRSFGVPYMSPLAPIIVDDLKDTLFRLPQWAMFSRPRLVSQKNVIREQNPPTTKPHPRE
ncbi:spore germination protein [Paenibacillus contaminans]|uniref:Spore germination protein n=1 Tax=Paenibacillus contaminans TaxID=450362 RepID=A0A329M2X4_9BACL|nr:spore germination protein [Paenibacillus contaminans]